MACGSCGTGSPGGCKSNGSCGTGSCNRMNVHDWLMNLPFSDPSSTCQLIEVSFNQGSRKDFYRNAVLQYFEKGEMVVVEGISGFDVGEVCLSGELVRIQLKKRGVSEDSDEIKKVLRRAGALELEKMHESKSKEKAVLIRSRAIARQLNLSMKIAEVEIQADGKKATFFYIADDRVDFRELIKIYATEFRVKVEMRQIGARQEAGKIGGLGSCGRELCCSTWLHDFKSVNTNAARYQNLSINQTKLSGQCGRLKCCLNYELDSYMDALLAFPDNADMLEMAKSKAILVKKDIFKNLMWYTLSDSIRQYPLTIARVNEIRELNSQGIRPEELLPADLSPGKNKEVEPEYADLVGQISLKSLEKSSRRNRDRENELHNQRNRGNDRSGSIDKKQQEGVSENHNRLGVNRPKRPGQPAATQPNQQPDWANLQKNAHQKAANSTEGKPKVTHNQRNSPNHTNTDSGSSMRKSSQQQKHTHGAPAAANGNNAKHPHAKNNHHRHNKGSKRPPETKTGES